MCYINSIVLFKEYDMGKMYVWHGYNFKIISGLAKELRALQQLDAKLEALPPQDIVEGEN